MHDPDPTPTETEPKRPGGTDEIAAGRAPDDLDRIIAELEIPKKSRKPSKTQGKPMPRKTDPPQDAPFQVTKYDAGQKAYGWIAEWPSKKPPGPGDLQAQFGPGRYVVKDASGREDRWRIHGVSEDEENGDYEEHPSDHQPHPRAPAPYPPPQPWAPVDYRQHAPPPPMPHAAAYGAPPQAAQPDPYVTGMLARMDAAVNQIQTENRRIQDEIRSMRYDLEQIPHRVTERVQTAFQEATDPIETMTRLWDTTRRMADGMPVADEGGGGLESLIVSVLNKIGQAAPPPPAALPQPPPAPVATAAPDHLPDLAGMTEEIRGELHRHAAAAGIDYAQAIGLAQKEGWDAQTLLAFAMQNATPHAQG